MTRTALSTLTHALAATALAGLSTVALASEPETCPPADELVDAERWLRAASLDIRGVIPSLEEYQQISSPDALPEDLIDAWLETDAFVETAVAEHRSRLWNRIGGTNLISNRNTLGNSGGIRWIRARAGTYRGNGNLYCGDFPAEDADGDGEWDLNAEGQEGWVEIWPYWYTDQTEPMKICAFDAQDTLVSPNGIDCGTREASNDPECGCGPELQWCADGSVQNAIREAMGLAQDERVRRVIEEGRPYTDLFFEDVLYINGPLSHFYRFHTDVPAGLRFDIPPFDIANTPELAFADEDTWVGVPTHPAHAGMLTDPAFLVRFMTNRARVNRFYEDFLCQPLVAPENGIELDGDVTLDLANRSGCAYCHAIIEPSGAYWGRFMEGGGGFMDPDTYPAFDALCEACSTDGADCPDYCSRWYVTDPNSEELYPYIGLLNPLQFRPESEHGRIDEGPGGLVQAQIASGNISQCLTKKTANWLLGRDLTPGDADLVDAWDLELLASDWDYRTLVKQIVLSETYRRVR
jgi:hypothetical protein